MKNAILSTVLVLFAGLIFSGKTLAQTATTKVGFNGSTVDEIKKAFDNNSLSFVVYTADGFDQKTFEKDAAVYSKMFSVTSETVSNNITYTVKFSKDFKDMKYLMRLFITAGIKEVHFGTEVMSTEKFFAQFN